MEAGAEGFKQEDVIMWAHFDAIWRMDQRVKRRGKDVIWYTVVAAYEISGCDGVSSW